MSLTLVSLLIAAAGLGTGVSAGAVHPRDKAEPLPQAVEHPHGRPLSHPHAPGFFDVRLQGPEREHAANAVIAARAVDGADRTVTVARLRGLVNGLIIDDDPILGTPGLIGSPFAMLTPGDGAMRDVDAIDSVRGFLLDCRGLFGVGPEALGNTRVVRDYLTAHSGTRHIQVQQQIEGIDLFACELRATVTPHGGIVSIASTLLPEPAPPEGWAIAEPKFDEVGALFAAMLDLGITPSDLPRYVGEWTEFAGTSLWSSPDLRPASDEPTCARRVVFPLTRSSFRPAWLVTLPIPGEGHTFDMVIDAIDGRVLRRSDRLVCGGGGSGAGGEPATFRVFTSDSPSPFSPGSDTPAGVQPPGVARSLVTIQPSEIAATSPNGWIPVGQSGTVGNNVDAHLDVNGDNIADLPRVSGTPDRVFDFPLDLTQPPAASRSAGVAQGFYLANRFHDRLYALGFDEGAGNFQQNNFGRGGVGNDAIQLDCADGSGTNNANFNGGADGTPARIQMYLWTGTSPDRDGVLDAELVFHEFAHGLSKRLHGGQLDNFAQSGGLGEGWSDFFALALNAAPGDNIDGTYAFSAWVAGAWRSTPFLDNYYYGLRRFPYSTDFSRNPLTLADIDPALIAWPASVPLNPGYGSLARDASEVHNAGEVWCSALWQARAEMLRAAATASGGDPSASSQANDRMMRLVVDGMKTSPGNPTFVQARDGILRAELISHRGALAGALWTGFAARGLGSAATVPQSGTTSGVLESFEMPRTVIWSYPDGLPNVNTPGQSAAFRFSAAPLGVTLSPGSLRVHFAIDDGPFASVPAIAVSDGSIDDLPIWSAPLPAAGCGQVVKYYLSAETSLGVMSDPPGAPQFARRVATGTQHLALTEDFEGTDTWTRGPDTAGEGRWVRADPAGYSNQGRIVQPADDHTPVGTLCYNTGANFFQQLTLGRTILNSPSIDLTGATDAEFTYWRWFINNAGSTPYAATLIVQLSNDGGATWVTAETVGPGTATDPNVQGGWRQASVRLSPAGLAPTAATRVRFIADNTPRAGFVFAAIDDVSVRVTRCEQACPADFDGSGAVDADDLADYINCYLGATAAPGPPCAAADIDASGSVNADDLAEFVNRWVNGC